MARHWYQDRWLLGILAIVFFLTVLNLGDRHFWGDEIHLLNLGKSIAAYGVPIVDDDLKRIEVTYEVDDVTRKIWEESLEYAVYWNGREVYSLHPWLVSYIAAAPMMIFGPFNEFMIRLPFVLIGLLAIPVAYALARRISSRRRVALLTAGLLAGSIVYLVALRNANYYGLVLFAVPATVLCYLRTLQQEKHAWWQFALAGTMLFHSQWLVFMGTMLGIALHFVLFHRTKTAFKRVLWPLASIFLLTFPWFVLTDQFSKTGALSSPLQYVLLLAIGAYHMLIWFVPIVFAVFVPALIVSRDKMAWRFNEQYALLGCVMLMSLLFIALNAYTGTPVRYFYGMLPLAMVFNATLLDRVWKQTRLFAIVLLVLLIATNWLHVMPLLQFQPLLSSIAGSQDVLKTGAEAQTVFVAKTLRPRILLAEYMTEIIGDVISPTRAMIDIINAAELKGADIFVGVGDANAIGYYTGLRPATYQNNFATRRYDWIVFAVNDSRNEQVDLHKYARRHIMLATDRWGDTADPAHHLFKTTECRQSKIGEHARQCDALSTGGGFFLYRKK